MHRKSQSQGNSFPSCIQKINLLHLRILPWYNIQMLSLDLSSSLYALCFKARAKWMTWLAHVCTPSICNTSWSYAGSALSAAGNVPRSGCGLILAWLNANKSAMGALMILALVIYAVFFPHPERGPREIAAEIMPTASRVNKFKGESRDIDNWQELHKQYVEEIKLKVARKEARPYWRSFARYDTSWGYWMTHNAPYFWASCFKAGLNSQAGDSC